MASSLIPFPSIDDKDLDDAELWAVIDSAAAAATHLRTPTPVSNPSPPPPHRRTPNHRRTLIEAEGEVVHEPSPCFRPAKVAPVSTSPNPLAIVRNGNRMVPESPSSYRCSVSSPETYLSPEIGKCGMGVEGVNGSSPGGHSLEGRFPSVGLFKEFQNAAMAILEKTDFTMISGHPFIKKTGWRKMAFYFNISFEIKDKTIEFDDNRNVQRAEFVVRAQMQGGRFSDAWGSCERREKKFLKPNHDIPSTAETRAKKQSMPAEPNRCSREAENCDISQVADPFLYINQSAEVSSGFLSSKPESSGSKWNNIYTTCCPTGKFPDSSILYLSKSLKELKLESLGVSITG